MRTLINLYCLSLCTLLWVSGGVGATDIQAESGADYASSVSHSSPVMGQVADYSDVRASGSAFTSGTSSLGSSFSRQGVKSGWDQASLWVGYRHTVEFEANHYRLQPGLEVGIVGFDPYQRLTLTGFTAQGAFLDAPIPELHNLRIYGWSLSMSQPVRLDEHWTLSYGAGYTSGLLIWDYTEPPSGAEEEVTTDSLGFHGLVLPITLGTQWGPLWAEVDATPTLRLAGARTRAGLHNDLTTVQVSLPVSLRLGVLF